MVEMTDAQIASFWSRVGETPGCWEWAGRKNSRGYGLFTVRGCPCAAHRIAFQLKKGEIPSGLLVCHSCDNPSCVNPDHLFLGTHQDNHDDMVAKGRRWKPPPGHRQGESNPQARLTTEKVKEIVRLAYGGAKTMHLARDYGVSPGSIINILHGRSWKNVEHDQPYAQAITPAEPLAAGPKAIAQAKWKQFLSQDEVRAAEALADEALKLRMKAASAARKLAEIRKRAVARGHAAFANRVNQGSNSHGA